LTATPTPPQIIILAPSATATTTHAAPGFYLSVRIFNASGEEVRLLGQNIPVSARPQSLSAVRDAFVPQLSGTAQVLVNGPGALLGWDGRSDSGQVVGSGSYSMLVGVHDAFGNVENWNVALTVLNLPAGATVEVFNSAGELVWSEQHSLSGGSTLSMPRHELVAGTGIKIDYGYSASDSTTWMGVNSRGEAVRPGSYLVKVTQQDENGALHVYTQSVVVLQDNAPAFSGLAAWPNPAGHADSVVTVQVDGAAYGSRAEGEVFNLAGERVAGLGGDLASGNLRWELSPKLASGVYLIRVRVTDPSGKVQSGYVKASLAR
jgi:hypothetical protein